MIVDIAAAATDGTAFNNAQTASGYSTLSGVLAGFSFFGLTLIITQRLQSAGGSHPNDEAINRATVLLLTSFLGLMVTSLAYAVISGEGDRQIAAVEHVVAGVGFMSSTLTLLLALEELILRMPDQVRMLTHVLIGYITPVLAFAYVVAGAFDAAYSGKVLTRAVAWGLFLSVVAAIGVVWLARRRLPRSTSIQSELQSAFNKLAVSGILVTVASSVVVPIISAYADIHHHAPNWLVWVAVGIAWFGACSFAVFCVRFRPVKASVGRAAAPGLMPKATPNGDARVHPNGRDPAAASGPHVSPLLDADVLATQARDIFPAGYQTSISVIQGVALSALALKAIPAISDNSHDVPLILRSLMSLFGIILVAYGYLWFTALMRWNITVLDIAVPYLLGVGEIVSALEVEDVHGWWVGTAIFAFLGAGAYANTWSHLRAVRFSDSVDEEAEETLRRLLARLTLATLATAVLSTALLMLVGGRILPTYLLTWGPGALLLAGLVLAVLSEVGLRRLFEISGVARTTWFGRPRADRPPPAPPRLTSRPQQDQRS